MASAESLPWAEKIMALLQSAAGLGMTATLNLETRTGRICTTFTCEELRVPDGIPSSNRNAGKKKNKSNGSSERSKERIKYQEGKQKDLETGEK